MRFRRARLRRHKKLKAGHKKVAGHKVAHQHHAMSQHHAMAHHHIAPGGAIAAMKRRRRRGPYTAGHGYEA